MGKLTFLDIIKGWYWFVMLEIMNYVLKHHGYNFGVYYMEEIEKMYRKYEDEIIRT